ncbi:Hemocytin like protein [Argiope bruennichi]|uniref:Hemocytin like protein n=1 Tax=Argiope bruennichi TaxID=94029 RepID=A0A8T0EBS1_ARGBR|nr:Hemocytin like protein [Argiope bruennichi]
MNIEFGKCPFEKARYKQAEQDKPMTDEELSLFSETGEEDEDVQFGRLYYGTHGSDVRHMPFIRSSHTAPMDAVVSKIILDWKLPEPKIVLFVIAGSTDSVSESIKKLSILLIKGLINALETTEMWLCTDGFYRGFGRELGLAFLNERSRRKILMSSSHKVSVYNFPETALIGLCRQDILNLSEKLGDKELSNEEDVREKIRKKDINRNFDYFLLVKDTSEKKRGLQQFLLNFASYLIDNAKNKSKISNDLLSGESKKRIQAPVLSILFRGDVNQIDLILGYLKDEIPVVVMEGSGGLSDLLAFAYHQVTRRPEGVNIAEYTEAVLKPQLSEKISQLYPDISHFKMSEKTLCQKVFDCIRFSRQEDMEFLSVLTLYDLEKKTHFPAHLLEALFKARTSKRMAESENMKRDLFLAMDWNCPTEATTQVLARDSSGEFQVSADTFFRALVKPQREEFIGIFLKKGFIVHKFLNSLTLLQLFQDSLQKEFFKTIIWENVLGFGARVEMSRHFVDFRLTLLLEELTSIPSLINTYELDWNCRGLYDNRSPSEVERKSLQVLVLWGILSYRVELVKVIWRYSEHPIHIAIICCVILHKLEKYVTDLNLKNEMIKQSKELSLIATNLMTKCYDKDPNRALDLLCEKDRVWSYKPLIEIAAFAKNRVFIAHPCCQKYLDSIFMDKIEVRDLPYGDFTVPLWLKIILSNFLIFPMFLWIRFETRNDTVPVKFSETEQRNDDHFLTKAPPYPNFGLIFISFPISSALGPMLYKIKRMTLVDFSSYMRVTMLVVISNGIVIHSTIYPDFPLGWELVRRAFFDAIISFFLTPADHFGQPDMTCIRLIRHPNGHSFVGLPENVCKVGRYYRPDCPNPGVWPHIFGLQYLLLLRLILLTLLYALFNATHAKLVEEGENIWKYQRYQLVIDFSNRLTFPAPLSPINYCILLYNFICRRRNENFERPNLTETDYTYWKNLASDYFTDSIEEKNLKNTTEWRMGKILELRKALNDQRRTMRQLHANLNELQIYIKRDHQYLEDRTLQASVSEYLQIKNLPQIFSRISPYPHTKILRFPVSDKHVSWKYTWNDYDPITYNKPIKDFPPQYRQCVDVDIQLLKELEGEDFRFPTFKWNTSTLSPGGVFLDRKSWIKGKKEMPFIYELDEEGLPRNPMGRTGLRGRGCLPQWGPNHFVYAIISRWQAVESVSYRDYLEVVLLVDDQDISIPGGFVTTENPYSIISALFHCETVWWTEEDMIAFFLSLAQAPDTSHSEDECLQAKEGTDTQQPTEVSEKSSAEKERIVKSTDEVDATEGPFIFQRLKRGYMDEAINTDQSWCEAEVWHFHYNVPCLIDEKFKANMLWSQLDETVLQKIPIGQASFLHSVAKKMKAVLEAICVFDSCGCDMGGDCDCLCTAIAAYAQECSIHGVSIRWRSQELCPIQCEECATYDSCIPSCPKKTCENEYRYGRIEEACSNDFCVEGCNPKPCPAGQIYNNEVEYKCIPEVDCVVPCLEVNGVIYNEGDRVTDLEVADPCQSCHCHRGSIQCTGSRCVKQEPLRPCLKTGWTPWMNTPSFVGGDFEELTSPSLKATYEEFCGFTNMTTIECRVAETKISAQEAGQNVICELPTGLVCVDTDQNGRICEDYEIRMYCDCGPMLETTTLPPVTTPLITQPPECHANGWTAWMSSVLPSEQGEFETLERLRVNHIFCANQDIDDIECRSTRTWKYITEDTNDIICNKKVGFICNGPLCDDFEVRVHCYCGPEETTPLVIPETTPVAPKCISEWTQFYDVDHPSVSDASDDETIENIEQKEGPVCEGRNITDVECKAYVNGEYVDYSSLNLFGLKCSKKTGFVCEKFIIGEDCPNFMVRFYCSCEPTPETTTKLITTTTTTAAPTTTTTTPVPIKPVPVECGWTPWINTDTPEEGENDDGDLEDLATIQYLYKTCGGKDLVDIECRMARTHHSYELSQQHNLKCDLEHGFVCHNQDQIGKCYDYEIRLLCMYDWCYPKTTPPTTTTTTTPAPTTTANPCPDGQVYDECAYSCSQMCSSFASETVEKCSLLESGCIPACRPIDGCQLPYVWRDYFHCVPKDECPCVYTDDITNEVITAGPKAVVYKTCEKCQCLEGNLHCEIIPFCGVQPPVRRLIENIEQPDCWTKWESIDYPEGPGDLEKISEFRKVFEFCADPIKIECRTIATQQKPSDVGQNVKCDLQTGLVCFNKENEPDGCYDYEIRFYCPCPTLPPPTTTIPPPTLEPGECLYGWTEWFNNHYPDGRGDYESIQSSRVNHIFCANDMISAIECRKAGSLETGLLQRGVECDLQVGVICRQESLGEQEYCWDYEVRFFCDCPISTVVPYEIPITTTEPPLLKSCSYWSPWINDHHPNAGKSGTKTGVKGGGTFIPGDREVVTPVKLRRDYKFCLEVYNNYGAIKMRNKCREAVTDLFYTETGDNKLTCSVKGGFRCRGKDQESKICKDYKIRYYCACEEITPSPTPIKISTPAIHIEPCTVYYNAIDGPKPVPDSQLKASTSKDFESGPQSARLSSISTTRSAGAWIAGQIDDRQFIEVDLGFIQPIYGVVTKGRHGHPEWVKSYLVLYSRDGNAYAYVTEDGNNPQIFTGNYDSQTPIEHVFNTPFEARFVRIQPLSFQKEIALRFDVLGCAEGMTTPPVYTTSAPICTAEMGLRNGTIKDRQVTTSSNRNPSSDERYIRLKTIQTDDHAGGWVAGELDEYQFVQVDFVTPHEITGIKIQGRDSVPQWVTAFTVSYSQDGNSWDYITDITGTEKKIFPGNYDSDTIVEVYFPYPIRTRYVRINPAGWENWIALRLEILGCFEPDKVLANLSTTVEPPFIEACFEPMGLENHQLPDTLISVSSSAGPGSDKSRLRLNTHSDEQGTGGWIAHKDDYKPIIVIDFTGERNLTAIETQGLEDEDYWVMSYYVHYSSDNVTWEKAYSAETGNWIFDGNRDRDSRKLHRFTEMITARFLKVTIVDYHTWAALRMEVYGCFIPYGEVTMPPPLLITETEFCTILGPWLSLSDPASNPYGDEEQIDQIIAASKICGNPFEIECRSAVTKKDYSETGQIVTCDTQQGLLCLNQNQNSGMCYNYEVRIKCWTCEAETTTTARPLVLCPEVPESLKENCPVSCPEHHSCDGYGCVPDIDCPCFRDGKKFIPPNILVTKNCDKCECVLGGYSMCSPINCSSCLQGQKSELDEYCECRCIGCPDGTITCPTNGACVSEFQWCDGTEDCPDDEINCPTTPPPVTTTTTIAPTTTEAPIICTTEYADATDTCEMVSNMFETFDGLYYQYDICDHLLMREKYSNLYSVTVHKTCSPDNANSCDRYLIITVDNVVLKIGPGVDDVTVQDTRVPAENLYIVSRRFQDFELLKKGKFLVFSSKKYHFDVIWDGLQDARIIVSHCLMNQVIGMCGFYNKQVEDDRSTPDGTIVKTNQEFGDSWSKGPLERCIPPSCPEVYMKRAITTCQVLQDELFSTACADYLKMQSRVETCINYMCECLQRTSLDARVSSDVFYDIYDTGSCKCQAFESFVEACEAVKREPVLNWRLEYDCTPECPPGMEWQDCGPGCELTCDNYREKDTLCDAACTPGCYCPSGTVRHHDKCVKPKMCQDCVCRGHGDPNYITFDGRYYAFQGNCTYVWLSILHQMIK